MIERLKTGSLSAVFLLLVAGVVISTPVRAVTLRDTAEVELPPFTLQNVTRESLSGDLAGIQLGSLPRPGETRLISRAYIMMQARRQNKSVPSFQGDVTQIKVTRPSRTLTAEDIRDEVHSLLEDNLAVTDSVKIDIEKIPETVRILPGPYSMKLEGWNPYRKERGTTNYRINVIQRGEQITKFRIEASVSQNNLVPVATEPIARGQTMTKSLIEWKKRDISSLRGNLITTEKAVVGFKAEKNFKSGDIITADKLERPIVIERRDPITIVYKKNGFKITAKGEAQEDGARGDRIMVENRSSEVQLRAEVLDERRVLIRDGNNEN